MTRTRLLALAAIVLCGVIAISWWSSSESPTPPPIVITTPAPIVVAPPSTPIASQPELRATPRKIDKHTTGSPLAAELNAPAFDAQHDVATLHAMLRQYLRVLGSRQGRPIGNDSDLARVLTGRNPMKLVVLPPTHPALSPDGRLRDRWGTPYFIHPRGRLAFEIRSAGPDRTLFTADDLVENPGTRSTDANALTAAEGAEDP